MLGKKRDYPHVKRKMLPVEALGVIMKDFAAALHQESEYGMGNKIKRIIFIELNQILSLFFDIFYSMLLGLLEI